MNHRTQEPADLCSRLSLAADEQAIGTAAEANCWVVLEQDGPWGVRAAVESRLDPRLGAELDAAVGALGGRFALMRRPGAHPDRHREARRVLVAGGPVEAPWLLEGLVDSPRRLLDLPFDHLSDPSPARLLAELPELAVARRTVLLVCTNGKRDRCCAVVARPVAEAADRIHPDRVFETTHLGGHRFATTAVLLPSGHTYAHLEPDSAAAALTAADEGLVAAGLRASLHYRGRSGLSRPQQVAEHAFRMRHDDWSLPGPTVGESVAGESVAGEERWTVRVTSALEEAVVDVSRDLTQRLRPESCGKAPAPVPRWSAAVMPPLDRI